MAIAVSGQRFSTPPQLSVLASVLLVLNQEFGVLVESGGGLGERLSFLTHHVVGCTGRVETWCGFGVGEPRGGKAQDTKSSDCGCWGVDAQGEEHDHNPGGIGE